MVWFYLKQAFSALLINGQGLVITLTCRLDVFFGVLSSSSLFRSGQPCEQLRVHHTIEEDSQVGLEID